MKILDRYIRSTVIISTVLVSAVILGIQSFLSLVQQFQYVGQHGFTMVQAFLYVPMQLPAQFYQLFPIAGFLGALIGLTRLSSSSQLIVMRASGVSIVRITWSVMKAAVLMIIVVTAVGEGMGPSLQQHSELMQQKTLSASSGQHALLSNVWLHQHNGFTHIAVLKNQKTMLDIVRYHFVDSGQLSGVTAIKSGYEHNGQWRLHGLRKTEFLPDRVIVTTQKQAMWHFNFQPDLELQMSIATAEQTMMDLYRTIHYRQSIGLGANRFIFTFWQRVLQPVTTLVMICLAVPFVFGSFRSASMGLRIIAGVLIGFAFYMLNQLFGPITLVYQFPPLMAACIPTAFFFVVALLLLWKME